MAALGHEGARARSTEHPFAALLLTGAVLLVGTYATCPVALILGLPCPGCGLTRATWALLRGHWSEGVRLHPLAPLLLPAIAISFGQELASSLGLGRPRSSPRFSGLASAAWALLLAAGLAVWVLRFFGWLGGPAPVN